MRVRSKLPFAAVPANGRKPRKFVETVDAYLCKGFSHFSIVFPLCFYAFFPNRRKGLL